MSLADGKSNGYTGDNYTGFYFTAKNKNYESILEKFSRFFIDPILDSKYISSEILNVDSEHQVK